MHNLNLHFLQTIVHHHKVGSATCRILKSNTETQTQLNCLKTSLCITVSRRDRQSPAGWSRAQGALAWAHVSWSIPLLQHGALCWWSSTRSNTAALLRCQLGNSLRLPAPELAEPVHVNPAQGRDHAEPAVQVAKDAHQNQVPNMSFTRQRQQI